MAASVFLKEQDISLRNSINYQIYKHVIKRQQNVKIPSFFESSGNIGISCICFKNKTRVTMHCFNCRSSHQRCSIKKGVFRNFTKFTGKHLCQSLFLMKIIKQETLVQVFSCEFCEILRTSFLRNTSGRLLL